MKRYFYPFFLATALMTVACSDEDKVSDFIEEETPSGQKEAIAFTVSDLGAANQGAQTRAGFTGTTQIVARFVSEHKTNGDKRTTRTVLKANTETTNSDDGTKFSKVEYSSDQYIRYWDDAYGRNALISVYAVAIPNKATAPSNLADGGTPFIDLVHGTGTPVNATSNPNWLSDNSDKNDIDWKVTTTGQDNESIANEDLCYSNNIQDDKTAKNDDDNVLGVNGRYVYDFVNSKYVPDEQGTGNEEHKKGPLRIALKTPTDPTSSGKFDKGHLVFKHALSRISITLEDGDGFTDKPFAFATGTNIKLLGMNVSGKLNIKTGEWYDSPTTGDINKMALMSSSSTKAAGEYMAQMLPGYTFGKTSNTNVMEFTIDDNTYYITQKMLFDALTYDANNNGTKDTGDGDLISMKDQSGITMEQGKKYNFKIKINKTKIENITATLTEWSEVTAANESINNAHVEFTTHLEEGASRQTIVEGLHLFRRQEALDAINTSSEPDATAYSGAYTDEATSNYAGSKWSTDWYYENNKTAYHFRALNGVACYGALSVAATDRQNFTDDKKAFNMYNGATATNDYHWGAPFTAESGTKYYEYKTSNGFNDIIHKGITSTKSVINITQLHMMSQIKVIVRTTDKTNNGTEDIDASNSILLESGDNQCEVTLTRLYNHGTVDIGTGLITIDETTIETDVINGIKVKEPMTKPAKGITSNNETEASRITIDGKAYSTKQTGAYTFNVIPQPLKRGTATDTTEDFYVGITITTPDHNQYYVVKRLSEILATSISSTPSQNQTAGSTTGNEITYWYPNHKYIYTFTITKKGIENITCTLADWTNVNAGNTNITLED